jgi:hypothetical protein
MSDLRWGISWAGSAIRRGERFSNRATWIWWNRAAPAGRDICAAEDAITKFQPLDGPPATISGAGSSFVLGLIPNWPLRPQLFPILPKNL